MKSKSIIEEATEKYLNARATAIDQELFTFLREHAVSEATNIDDIRKDLKAKNLELVRDYISGETEEVHTFKLCRVFAQTSFNIPNPKINII